jgi:hypothetical protein
MAAIVYLKYKEALLTGSANISLTTGTVKVIGIDTGDYTYGAAHDFLDDVAAAARVGTATLTNGKAVTSGVFDADDVTMAAVVGDQFEALIIYIDTGAEATSRLVAYIDSGTGLPFTPSGGNITITWDNGANKIFAL